MPHRHSSKGVLARDTISPGNTSVIPKYLSSWTQHTSAGRASFPRLSDEQTAFTVQATEMWAGPSLQRKPAQPSTTLCSRGRFPRLCTSRLSQFAPPSISGAFLRTLTNCTLNTRASASLAVSPPLYPQDLVLRTGRNSPRGSPSLLPHSAGPQAPQTPPAKTSEWAVLFPGMSLGDTLGQSVKVFVIQVTGLPFFCLCHEHDGNGDPAITKAYPGRRGGTGRSQAQKRRAGSRLCPGRCAAP